MATRAGSHAKSHSGSIVVWFAWLVTLVFSDLPEILWTAFTGDVTPRLVWGKLAALALLTAVCFVVRRVRPLWQYSLVLLVFHVALVASSAVGKWAWWQHLFQGPNVSFTVGYVGAYLRDLGVASAVILTLWLVKRRRSEFFLVIGDLDAPIAPVRWLGIGQGGSWRLFGWIFGLVAACSVLVLTAVSMRPSVATLLRAAPLLPSVLLFAAVNAFTEEVYFRASLLSTLHGVVGRSHALLITVVLFGLAHYLYGTPSGIAGFAMTGFLAYLLGKSMLETRGLLWPWCIHFLPDVVIFGWYAVAWVQR